MRHMIEITGDRLENGVRRRIDNAGDPWAQAHREHLDNEYYFQDNDVSFGLTVWGQNTGERLFLEYVPDTYQNRGSRVRRFAIVALFDRKSTVEIARASTLATAVYAYECRCFSSQQPVPARFFWVIGGAVPPWALQEVDINTGEECGELVVLPQETPWAVLWEQLGLSQARQELRRWLGKSQSVEAIR